VLILTGPALPVRGISLPERALSQADLGVPGDPVSPGRWGEPSAEDGRTYRIYPGPRSLSYVALKTWWNDGDVPPADVAIVVDYKDTTPAAVGVLAWSGTGPTWGYNRVGQVGGANDGKWKDAVLICPRTLLRRHRSGPYKGNCSLLFSGGGRIAVDRIRILPLTDALRNHAVGQARAARSRSLRLLTKQFKHVPRKKAEPALEPVSPEHRRLGFIPFVRSYLKDVYPDTIPDPKERGAGPLKAYATLGEYEPLQAAACALRDLTITVAITDLRGPGTLRAGTDVKVYRIESVPMRVGSSWGKQWRIMPAWMRPNEPVEMKAGTSQSWYITVHVPPDARPGLYKGRFTLSAGAERSASFPVEFRVLPFALDRADHIARGPYVSGVIAEEFIQDLAEHGMNSMSTWTSGAPRPRLVNGRCVAEVPPAVDDYLRKLKKAGFVRMVFFGGGDPRYRDPAGLASATKTKVGSPEFARYYGQFWKDIRRLEAQRGWPEMICCPFDEPVKSAAKTANYLACYEAVKAASPETKVFCVFMNRRSAAEKLGLKADIWSCNGAFDVNSAHKRRLAGKGIHKLFYTYTGCMGSTRPGSARYNAGVLPWHYDADGTYFWAYLWTTGDPFNDLDGGTRDWSPVARDADGIVYGCIGWEGYREGVDDQRYIQTCLRLAREKGRKDILARIAKLKAGVLKGEESAESARTRGLDDFFFRVQDTNFMDVYRSEVAGMILEMLGEKQ